MKRPGKVGCSRPVGQQPPRRPLGAGRWRLRPGLLLLEGQADWTQEVKRRGELTQAASMELGPLILLLGVLALALELEPVQVQVQVQVLEPVQVLEQALVPERSALLVPVPLLGRSVLEPALVPVLVLVLVLELARAPLALVPQLA